MRFWSLTLVSFFHLTALGNHALAQDVRLQVGYIPVLGVSQLFVTQAQGWAKQAGLDLVVTRFDSGPAMIQALASDKLDALYIGVSPVIVARVNGIGVSVLAATATEEIALVGRGDYAAEVKKTGSAATAIASFAAKTGRKLKISTQPAGSVPDTVTRYWLNEIAKVPANSVEILPMGIEKTQQALLAKAVDVAAIREPVITIIRDLDPDLQVVALGGEIFPGQPGSVLAVRDAVRRAHPQAIATLIALHIEATALLTDDPKRAAASVHKYIGAGLTDLATLERAVSASKFIADPDLIREAVEKMQIFQKSIGSLPQTAPLQELFDSSVYRQAMGGRG